MLNIPDTLCGLLDLRANASPEAIACGVQTAEGSYQEMTWRQYHQKSLRLAALLERAGVGHGTVVSVLLPTSVEYEWLSHALMRLGAVMVGVEAHAAAADTVAILQRCGARFLITSGLEFQRLRASQLQVKIILTDELGESATSTDAVMSLQHMERATDESSEPRAWVPPGPHDLATIIFTSGTTGEPKGIPYSHIQVMAACRALTDAYPELGPQDRMICWLPLSALFQRMANLMAMARGMKVFFIDDPSKILNYIAELRPTFHVGVPRFYEKLDEALRSDTIAGLETGLQSVKYMISGSAPLQRKLLDSLLARGILILEAYGLSENTVPIALNRATDYRFGSVGKPLPPNQVRLGESGDLEGEGEVEVRGIGLFSHYLGSSPADYFTGDGFYRTGDLARFDSDGYLYLTGRMRDIIKTSTGRRIGPTRIEEAYSRCRQIDRIVIIGEGRKYLVAILTLVRPESHVDLPKLLDELQACESDLPEHERVRAFGVLMRPFRANEVTSSLKLRRGVIARNYAEFIERLYAETPPCILQALPTAFMEKETDQP